MMSCPFSFTENKLNVSVLLPNTTACLAKLVAPKRECVPW